MIVIVDLDGTLAISLWRKDLRDNWDEYFAASKDDMPNMAMVSLIQSLSRSHRIVCITSRPEKWRQLSMQWLVKYAIPIDDLLMRPVDDRRPSPELKAFLFQSLNVGSTLVLAIDDRTDVIAAYQAMGFATLLTKEV